MTWEAVKDELYREYQNHDGYLPHHAERTWAPRMGVKPNSLRTRFTNDLKRVCEEHWRYRPSPSDLALIDGTRSPSDAFELLRAAGRTVPPFAAFVYAFWSARRPGPRSLEETFDRCLGCRQDDDRWRAERGLKPA
jgi:hypothetical protein